MDFKAGDVVVCVKLAHPEYKHYPLVVGHPYKITASFRGSVMVEGLNGGWSDWQFAPLVLENV